MHRLIAFFVGCWIASIAPAQFSEAWVEPAQQYDVEIKQPSFSDNVYLENNTRLFMSSQITTLEDDPKILQAHVQGEIRDVVPILSDTNLIGPQGSLLSGGWSTIMRYDQPRGRNCRVTVITAGLAYSELTPEERHLHDLLLGRFIFDQFLVPGLNWLCGVKLDNKAAAGVIAGMVTGHNSQILEQFRDAVRSGSPTEVCYAMWQFMVREIETGGPIASYIARKYGTNLAEKLAERVAKQVIKSFIPGVNAVDKMLWMLNTGGTLANMTPAVMDVYTVPTKLEFNVYFTAGLGGVYPHVIRLDGKDDEITLRGNKLIPVPGKTFQIRVYDKNTGKFHEVDSPRPTTSGHSLTFNLPESSIGNRSGPLSFELLIDKQVILCPETVQLVQDLVVNRIVPDHGPPGTRVRIYGDGVYPYEGTNTVLMQLPEDLRPSRTPVELISRQWLEFVVPPSSAVDKDTPYQVRIEESHGSTRKESRALTFMVEPGTYDKLRQRQREARMPEGKFRFTGTLNDSTPARTHLFEVPAGMQVEAELLSVSGPNQSQTVGELEYWNMSVVVSPDGAPLQGYSVGPPNQNVRSGFPAQRIYHTTRSLPAANRYGISLRKKSAEAVSYVFEVRLYRRDDALSGFDAGHDFAHALPIRNNERYNSGLSSELLRVGEDVNDMYVVEGIANDKEIVVNVSGAPTTAPFKANEGTVRSVTLYCQGDGDPEPYPVAWHEVSLGARPTTVNFVHSASCNRRYFIDVASGVANTEYWVEVAVRPAIPPPKPLAVIASDFNQSSEEWRLSGNFQPGTRDPQHQKFPGGGYVYAADASLEETVGPLDVMIVVDTTGSMGGTIQSVRDSTLRIIEELRRRTSSLQVGLVSFKDVSADGAAARSIVPLSSDIERSLAAVRGWTASGGGSDGPEDLLYGLKGALQSTWRTSDGHGRRVARVVIAVTDVPPKVNSGGADFEGNTLGSIGRLAAAQDARIYPLIVSADSAALDAAETLSAASGGKTLQLTNQSEVAEALITSCHAALEPSAPMYWEAPSKFLGDKRAYEGSNLSFLMYSYMPGVHDLAEPFVADDVIIEGAGLTLGMRSGIRPDTNVGVSTNWQPYVVPLDPRGKWVHTADRRPATAKEIGDALGSLTKLKIRADYYSGDERIMLNEVRMGEHDKLTDRGLDAQGQELLEILDRWIALSSSTSKQVDNAWTSAEADERLQKRFVDKLGQLSGTNQYLIFSGSITLRWSAYTNPGAKERAFSEVTRLLRRLMLRLRTAGTTSAADLAQAKRVFAQWRRFATSANGQLENLAKIGIDLASGEERLRTLNGTAYNTQLDANEALRKRFDLSGQDFVNGAEAIRVAVSELL